MTDLDLGLLPADAAQLGVDLCEVDQVWVRSAWCREGEQTWHLRLLEIVAGQEPAGSGDRVWQYPDVSFSSRSLPGSLVGGWFADGKVMLDGREHEFDRPTDRFQWARRQSRTRSGYEVLQWPTYEVQLGLPQANEPQQPLLSDEDAPSFISFRAAAASFFGLGPDQPGGSFPSFALFRKVDTRARINRVDVAEEQVRVEVQGSSLDGMVVELAGDAPGPTVTLAVAESIATVSFLLPDGLPAGAWVVIRAGSEWLDRRFLTWPWARGQEAGVTVEVTAKTRIGAFIAAGESDSVEFKQQLPDQESSKARVMKTVCAFANGSGGSILFGITDDYEVAGLPAAKISRFVDQLSELVDAWVEPTPPCRFETLLVEGTQTAVIELIVSAGQTLFGSSKPNEPRRVYVRHHSRSIPARMSEIESIVQSRTATTHPRYPGL